MSKIYFVEATFEISSKTKLKVKGKTVKVESKTRKNILSLKCNIVWSETCEKITLMYRCLNTKKIKLKKNQEFNITNIRKIRQLKGINSELIYKSCMYEN